MIGWIFVRCGWTERSSNCSLTYLLLDCWMSRRLTPPMLHRLATSALQRCSSWRNDQTRRQILQASFLTCTCRCLSRTYDRPNQRGHSHKVLLWHLLWQCHLWSRLAVWYHSNPGWVFDGTLMLLQNHAIPLSWLPQGQLLDCLPLPDSMSFHLWIPRQINYLFLQECRGIPLQWWRRLDCLSVLFPLRLLSSCSVAMCKPSQCQGLRTCTNRYLLWTRRWIDHGRLQRKRSSDCSSRDTWFLSTGHHRHRISQLSCWVLRPSNLHLASLRCCRSIVAYSLVPCLLRLLSLALRTSWPPEGPCAFDSLARACVG